MRLKRRVILQERKEFELKANLDKAILRLEGMNRTKATTMSKSRNRKSRILGDEGKGDVQMRPRQQALGCRRRRWSRRDPELSTVASPWDLHGEGAPFTYRDDSVGCAVRH